jgi:hypothetical protein
MIGFFAPAVNGPVAHHVFQGQQVRQRTCRGLDLAETDGAKLPRHLPSLCEARPSPYVWRRLERKKSPTAKRRPGLFN